MARVFNFGAGPAALPEPVLKQAAAEMLDWQGTGMSVMEMSHRGKEFIAMHAEAEADLRELLGIPANYKVLFLQGGGAGQFSFVPMNLLRGKAGADYVDTGEWAQEGHRRGQALLQGEYRGQHRGHASSPVSRSRPNWKFDPEAAYVHITSNETIDGVEWNWIPDTGGVPLVADMSSHILSRPLDVSRYGLIYAGAQKNIGTGGAHHGYRARRSDRAGDAGDAFRVRLQGAGRRRLDGQHAAHVRDLHRRASSSSG